MRGGIPFPIVGRFRSMKQEAQDRDRQIAASEGPSGGEMFLIRPDEARKPPEISRPWPQVLAATARIKPRVCATGTDP